VGQLDPLVGGQWRVGHQLAEVLLGSGRAQVTGDLGDVGAGAMVPPEGGDAGAVMLPGGGGQANQPLGVGPVPRWAAFGSAATGGKTCY
jgi:hypothetical protein